MKYMLTTYETTRSFEVKHNTMYSVVRGAAFAFTLLIPAGQALADDMLFENQIDGYAQVESYIYPSGTNLEAADDFTVTGTIERIWIYGGNCCLTSCSFPTDIIEVTIRFYADDNGQPGELLAEYVLDGDDPAFVWNEPAGPTLLDVTLPQPFEADGTYFISAQPEFDTFFCWRWWISNFNSPVASPLWTRDNQAGGDWEAYVTGLGDELNADLAFAITRRAADFC